MEDQEAEKIKEKMAQKKQEEQAEQQINQLLRIVLTTEAKERLSNVKMVNPGLYYNTIKIIMQMVQQGKKKINEEEMKKILHAIHYQDKKEMTIRRK